MLKKGTSSSLMESDKKLINKYNNKKKYLIFLTIWVIILTFSIIFSINYILIRSEAYLINSNQLKFSLELIFYIFWLLAIISNWVFSIYFWAKKSYEKIITKKNYQKEIKLLRIFSFTIRDK